ncbi:MAG: D-ribose pyranase [Thermomicrobiales bacterium]
MKKSGILNPALSHLLASSGHTDYFTISDRGFPVPYGPLRIDLALVDGVPTVLEVLAAIHAEWAIDRIVIAEEMTIASPERVSELEQLLGTGIPLQRMPHMELKRLAATGKATVRTGDTVPYANIIVVSG